MALRIAVLWISAAVAMSAHMVLMLMDPVVMKKLPEWASTASTGDWILTAMFWLVPLWMAFAVTVMKGGVRRWLQFGAAVGMTGLNVVHFLMCGVPVLEPKPYPSPVAQHVLLVGSTVVATALVAMSAWRWPKEEL